MPKGLNIRLRTFRVPREFVETPLFARSLPAEAACAVADVPIPPRVMSKAPKKQVAIDAFISFTITYVIDIKTRLKNDGQTDPALQLSLKHVRRSKLVTKD